MIRTGHSKKSFHSVVMETNSDQRARRKRRSENNKMFLQPNFNKNDVSSTNLWRWSKIRKLDYRSNGDDGARDQRAQQDTLLPMNGPRVIELSQKSHDSSGCRSDGDCGAQDQRAQQDNDLPIDGPTVIKHSQKADDPSEHSAVQDGWDVSDSKLIEPPCASSRELDGIREESPDNTSIRHASSFDYSGDDEYSETSSISQVSSDHNEPKKKPPRSAEPITPRVEKTDDTVMFPKSGVTVHEVGTTLVALGLRHHFSYEATTDIANFIKLLSGDALNHESLFNKYYMEKHYNSDKSFILKYHFYCQNCEREIVHETSKDAMTPIRVVCQGCDFEQDVTFKNLNYFISIDLRYQFSQLLQCTKIRSKIIEASDIAKEKAKLGNARMSSASHGDLYRNLPYDDPRHIIATNVNTDGAPVAENSVLSMWPVTLRINELSTPESVCHTMVSGMMVIDHEPSHDLLDLYLDTVLVV
ncbi:hypothetical protein QAD02_008448 [Eretmocerus hayati]|uniref:Uncharacterized protein n=1 Tax=Eretmocerus hayati TaxID=131215 RepID=A0ACC2N6T1_9HYME|nr:hypothetical protein QAD02_008448 [Eretmocerus hayati]